MSAVLEPQLTRLDERVLAELRWNRAKRASQIVRALRPRYGPAPLTLEEDVRLILRGFEHLGKAECRGNGWWRRVA